MNLRFLGLEQDFLQVDALMASQVEAVQKKAEPPVILACSYQPTITLGLRSNVATEVKISAAHLRQRGIACVPVKRGGQATFQGPGQLALYPIHHLPSAGMSVRDHMAALIEVTHTVIRRWGTGSLDFSGPKDGLGVWLNGGKVGFIGVRVQHGVTSYGLNLNIGSGPAGGDFALIHPCGQADLAVAHLGSVVQGSVDFQEFAQDWAEAWARG